MCTPIHPLIHEGRTENPKWRFTSLFVHFILLPWWTKKWRDSEEQFGMKNADSHCFSTMLYYD